MRVKTRQSFDNQYPGDDHDESTPVTNISSGYAGTVRRPRVRWDTLACSRFPQVVTPQDNGWNPKQWTGAAVIAGKGSKRIVRAIEGRRKCRPESGQALTGGAERKPGNSNNRICDEVGKPTYKICTQLQVANISQSKPENKRLRSSECYFDVFRS